MLKITFTTSTRDVIEYALNKRRNDFVHLLSRAGDAYKAASRVTFYTPIKHEQLMLAALIAEANHRILWNKATTLDALVSPDMDSETSRIYLSILFQAAVEALCLNHSEASQIWEESN